ncbi:MAG: response regulator [bacterium]
MQKASVLLVDDEKEFVEFLAKRIREREIEVEYVFSGEEAVDIVKKRLFDVAVVDIKMPGMDGVETLKELKKLKPTMEIIMLTGHASLDSGIQSMKIGAFDYLVKPFDFSELMNKINNAFAKKRGVDEKVQKEKISELMRDPWKAFDK